MNKEKKKSILESLLFVSGESLRIDKISKILECEKEEAKELVDEISKEYKKRNAGCVIVGNEEKIQMVTNPENGKFVDKIIKGELQDNLTKSALEVLSIVAYRGPISRMGIEEIRGVNSSFLVRNLLLRGLIERMENPNDSRGYLYKITFDFLKKLGVEKVEDLPDFEKLSKDERVDKITEEEKQ